MCTERYIYPFTDFGFKLLFGTAANKEFLISFLNSLLDRNDRIVDINYKNTEKLGLTPDDRKAVYDLYCETDDGTHLIVEMQNAYQKFFVDRTIFYSTFPMQEAAKKGRWDYELPPVYTVSFLNFVMPDNVFDTNFKHVIRLADVETHRVPTDKLTFIYLEMPNFNKEITELETLSDNWMYVIENLARLDQKPPQLRDKIFKRFFEVAEIARFSPEERLAYETSLKIMRDYENTINSAEEKGLNKGIEKGRAEGIEKGRAEGIAQERAASIRMMYDLDIPVETIAAKYGLSIAEIEAIVAQK